MTKLDRFVVARGSTVRDVIEIIDRGGAGIAIVLDGDGRLVGTITDGDVRRAILEHVEAGADASVLLGHRPERFAEPRTAPASTPPEELLVIMNEYRIRHVPLLDDDDRVVDIAFLSDLVQDYRLPLRAVVMAGGLGSRLAPLTEDMPKPMLPVGDKPLLERIVGQLREAGIHHVNLTTHYRSDRIKAHFGDGAQFGVDIRYTEEDRPLGTAGALALLEASDEPILVMNGDIVTRIDFAALLEFHRECAADLTVAVRRYEVRVPYGIVGVSGTEITDIDEKPIVRGFVNAGIYLLEPHVLQHVPAGERYDMTELIKEALAAGLRIASFPLSEYWLDIGQLEDYEQARRDAERTGG